MIPLKESFAIQELADAVGAGMTPRTIRYYIAEGLLPRPDGHGRFTSAHRDRLLLIQRLKEAYLPLAEIRARVASLRDDQVRAALAPSSPVSSGGSDGMMQDEQPSAASGSAAEYIARLRHGTAPAPPVPKQESAPAVVSSPRPLSSAPESPVPEAAPLPPPPETGTVLVGRRRPRGRGGKEGEASFETWQRFVLAPGVELSVRQSPTPEPLARVLTDRLRYLAQMLIEEIVESEEKHT